ncbi:MAG: glycosyltransferase family 87 protein [Polyangiales bacterium]
MAMRLDGSIATAVLLLCAVAVWLRSGAGLPDASSRLAAGAHRTRGLRALAPALVPLAAAGCCWYTLLRSPRGLHDDEAYLCAFRAVSAARSAYDDCPRYLYPPLLAQIGAAGLALGSERAVMFALRGANLLAAVWCIVLSLARSGLGELPRAWLGAALLLWSPSLQEALHVGNISPLVSAFALWGLLSWQSRPVAAGCALGLSIALKPLALAALPLLALHRALTQPPRNSALMQQAGATTQPSRNSALTQPQLLAAGATMLTFGVLSWPGRHELLRLLQQNIVHAEALHDVSLQRVAYLLGLAPRPGFVFVLVTASALLLLRRRPLSAAGFAYVSAAAALASQPVLWCHSLILAYPVGVAALSRALREPREPPTEKPHRIAKLTALTLACLCVAHSDLFGDLGELTATQPIVAMLAALPLGCAVVLTCYACGAE